MTDFEMQFPTWDYKELRHCAIEFHDMPSKAALCGCSR